MTFAEVEMKLAQYAQWAGNPLRPLGYPGRSVYARAIPDSLDEDALPQISDDEAQVVGDALLALKQFSDKAHTVIIARFLGNLTDDAIGRKYGVGTRKRVNELRIRGYCFLSAKLCSY